MKHREVVIPVEDFQRMIAPLLQQRLVAEGLEPGGMFTAVIAVDLQLAGEVSVRRLIDGSYVFAQRISEKVTGGSKSFKDEFADQRAMALKNGVD